MTKHDLIMESGRREGYRARYLLSKDSMPWYVPYETRMYMIREADFTCAICRDRLPASLLHIDHILSVANGGKCYFSNLQVLCRTCNLRKNKYTLDPISYTLRRVETIRIRELSEINRIVEDKVNDPRA